MTATLTAGVRAQPTAPLPDDVSHVRFAETGRYSMPFRPYVWRSGERGRAARANLAHLLTTSNHPHPPEAQ